MVHRMLLQNQQWTDGYRDSWQDEGVQATNLDLAWYAAGINKLIDWYEKNALLGMTITSKSRL